MARGLGVLGIGTCLALAYRFDVLSVVSPTPVAAPALVSAPLAAAPLQPAALPPDPIFLEAPTAPLVAAPSAVVPGGVQLVSEDTLAPVGVAETWVAPVAAPLAGLPAPAAAPAPARVTAAAPAPAVWPAPRAKNATKAVAQQVLVTVPTAAPAPNELKIDGANSVRSVGSSPCRRRSGCARFSRDGCCRTP